MPESEPRKVSLGHNPIASQNETKECQKVSLENKCMKSQASLKRPEVSPQTDKVRPEQGQKASE